MSGVYRVIWQESQEWWPSHEDFTDETAAHQFAADTMARVGEKETLTRYQFEAERGIRSEEIK